MMDSNFDWLVFTDIDGTLLNHHNYDVDAALPALSQLESDNIPVILNTSKTYQELLRLIQKLDIRHPFIVENGSAIFIPKGYFTKPILNKVDFPCTEIDDYWVLTLGEDLQNLQKFIEQHDVKAVNFVSCSVSQAMALTGLNEEEAELAQTRLFSIPLSFDHLAKVKPFEKVVKDNGYKLLKGGRFHHLIGQVDKASAMEILVKLYAFKYSKSFKKVCLGDSPNDLQMLQHADIPIIVKSPSSDQPAIDHPQLIRTTHQAPKGWAEGISKLTLHY
ncbi:MAG: HAD-IIB family hydrolase [Gammaproteobacteria bacterium]|nr:HAD-IIB family hydrolase [Gammaproteobacteria bacterium]